MEWQRRGLPAELFYELFSSLPLENAYGLLAKMANGILARSVQKMIKGIKETMKNNKLNAEDCGANLTISENGLEAIHSGPAADEEAITIRAVLPIPAFNLWLIKKSIISYFEVEILTKSLNSCWNGPNTIGFCDQQFPLRWAQLGWDHIYHDSIGICFKEGISVDESLIDFDNDDGFFEKGDNVGIGLILHPNSDLECFAICNRKLLGKVKLPTKFSEFQLFPAICLCANGDSIRVNFGKNKWQGI